jgi:hypothetical protein
MHIIIVVIIIIIIILISRNAFPEEDCMIHPL